MELHVSAVEWGAASRSLDPGAPLGDGWLAAWSGDSLLLAVFDALGHGAEAAAAAATAYRTLCEDPQRTLEQLIARCDRALGSTRGVTLGLARIDVPAAQMTWVGVGNVHGVVLRSQRSARPRRIMMVQRAGVVGRRIPPLMLEHVALAPGDLLLLATDGIDPQFAEHAATAGPPRRIAERLLERYFLGSDDGLVLAAGFRGGTP